jgi:hypothetical protein
MTLVHDGTGSKSTHAEHGASVVQVDLGEGAQRVIAWLVPTVFLMAFAAALATCATISLYIKYQATETEVRMQEYYLLELDAKFIGAGLKPADESIAKQQADRSAAK